MRDRSPLGSWLAALLLVTVACSAPAGDTAAAGSSVDEQLTVAVASFDLSVGDDQRFLAGVFTPQREIIGGGQVEFTFAALGEGGQPQPGSQVTGRFLPVPGSDTPTDLPEPTVLGAPASHDHEPGQADQPHTHGEPDAAGVYATTVDLDQPRMWEVTVTAVVDSTPRTGSAIFEVRAEHQVPAAGDPAPDVSTPTLASDLPAEAIDSRAGLDGAVPDEILHRTDLAEALAAGRPAVVVFSTPTYCTSRFCGPITDTVEQLAHRHQDRAAFVHVEIWENIDQNRMTAAVEPWIATEHSGSEPWVFLIGADGTITARWDNVLDEAELAALLDQLPAS